MSTVTQEQFDEICKLFARAQDQISRALDRAERYQERAHRAEALLGEVRSYVLSRHFPGERERDLATRISRELDEACGRPRNPIPQPAPRTRP